LIESNTLPALSVIGIGGFTVASAILGAIKTTVNYGPAKCGRLKTVWRILAVSRASKLGITLMLLKLWEGAVEQAHSWFFECLG